MKLLIEKVYNNYVIQIASNYNFGNSNNGNELQSGFAVIDKLETISINTESEELSKDLLSITTLTKNIEDATYFTDKSVAQRFSSELKRRVKQQGEFEYSASIQTTDLRINVNGSPEEFLESLPWTRTTKDTIKNDCMQQFNSIINNYGRNINDNPFLVYISNLDNKYGNGKYSGPAFTITSNLLKILLNDYDRIVDYEDFNNLNEDNIFMDNYFTRLTNSEQIVYIIQVYNWFQNSYNVRNYITDDANILKQFGVTDKNDVETLCMNVLKQGGKGEYNPAKVIENNLLKLENKNTKTLSSGNTSKNTTQIKTQSRNSERWNKFLGSKGEDIKNLSAADKEDLLSYIYSLSDNNTSTIGGEI